MVELAVNAADRGLKGVPRSVFTRTRLRLAKVASALTGNPRIRGCAELLW
jgi:hypothetical protein